MLPICNYRAMSAPTIVDDINAGYDIGSRWLNSQSGVEYVCVDPTAGAARWGLTGITDAWPAQTYRKPDNFAGVLAGQQPAVGDVLDLYGFLINRPITTVGIVCEVAGSAGAAVAFGLYASNPRTGKMDGEQRLGSNLGTADLTTPGAKEVGFTTRDLAPGLYWLGVSIKGVATMPIFKGMVSNGRHVRRGNLSDLIDGDFAYTHYTAPATYTGSLPSPCPTTVASAAPSPVPSLRSA